MTYCRQRNDLLDLGLLIPVDIQSNEIFIELIDWTLCYQPEALDNKEYNVVLLDEEEKLIGKAMSIDLEFKEVQDD